MIDGYNTWMYCINNYYDWYLITTNNRTVMVNRTAEVIDVYIDDAYKPWYK